MKQPTLMKIDRVAVADIDARNRLRPVSEAGVESLLASIAEVGVMKDPIHLRKKKDGSLTLIAGGHRLEAARRLGWTEVEARIWADVTDDWAAMMEIDDNLAGAEMNALDTAVFLATRKAVYERVHPETKRGVAGALVRWDATDIGSVAFVTATADKFGMTERQVFRIVAAGSKLNPKEVGQLRGAKRQVTLKDLDTIGRIDNPVERYRVVDLLANGDVKSAKEARNRIHAEGQDGGASAVDKPAVDQAFKDLFTLWKRTSKAVKRRLVAEVQDELRGLLADLEGDAS